MRWDVRKLLPRFRWHAHEVCKTIVLNRGTVQFDCPRSWFVELASDCAALFDRKPPAYESRLEVSCLSLPSIGETELAIADLIDSVTSKPRENATCGPLREEIRRGIELAWRDMYFRSTKGPQRALFRVGIAGHGDVHCLITYEYWGASRAACDDVWEVVLDTLVLDRVIADPMEGPRAQ